MRSKKVAVLSALLLSGIISLCCVSSAMAGGVSLGTTRVIYPQGTPMTSLSITNSDKEKVFLIQTWVTEPGGKKSADFVITPPIFAMQPQKENTMRIMYVGTKTLPNDRESLYYINSKAIPSGKPEEGKNTLQIATETTIKMFVRPENLPTKSIDAPAALRCKISGANVTVTNPTPYYVTMVNINVGNKVLPNTMVAPKSEAQIPVPAGPGGDVKFRTLNDFGSKTEIQNCSN